MKPEAESSGSKAKTEKKTAGRTVCGSSTNKKTAGRVKSRKSDSFEITLNNRKNKVTSTPNKTPTVNKIVLHKHVSDLEFLDTVKETVYKKLLDNELDLKIDSGFKAIELKNKISETSENERLLLEILSEIRSEELSKSQS
ncbi:MAG: hypothetical protein JSW64_12550 [Candidatus Zixiibacteriota bacterium]|nr:MAG: hypothetical protein JSW64_12550 [candidate division Zixibacteria bacterium]